MLATLLPMDGGSAELFGVDVRQHPHVIRQLLGVTGQYASVDENLTGRENLWLFGRLLGLSSKQARTHRRGPARPVRPGGRRRQGHREVLRRHAPPPRPRRQPDQPAAADLPRRAHHRPRPAHPRADVGHHPRAGGRRLHRAPDHPVPRRGRPARRPGRRHRPRPQGRAGHARRAQGPGRQLDPAAADARPGAHRRGRRRGPPGARRGAGAHARGGRHQRRPHRRQPRRRRADRPARARPADQLGDRAEAHPRRGVHGPHRSRRRGPQPEPEMEPVR